jgi:hypothetical protein
MILAIIIVMSASPVFGQQLKINSGAWIKNTGATIVVNGKVTNAGTITNSGAGTVKLTGDWQNDGTYTPTGCTVNLVGTSTQSLGGANTTTFENLTINNSSGISLSKGITVSNTLTFTTGKITTGSNTLSLGAAATVTGAGAGKYINGNLENGIASSTSSKTFEIGDASYYTPVTIDFSGTTNGTGTIIAKTTSGDHPNISSSTINPALSVNRYWTLTNSGVTGFSSFNASFSFDPANIDAGADYGSFIAGKYLTGAWSYPVTGTTASTSTQATGLSDFGDFQVGELSSPSAACLYGDNGSIPAVSDVMPCISNPVTVSTTLAAHQYFTMNVINGLTYQVYTCNGTSPANPLKLVVYKEGAPADPYLAFSSSNAGNPCTSSANNAYVTFTPAFSGQVRVLINRNSDCGSVTPSGLTVTVNVSGGSNLQDNQTNSGSDTWIGHIYDGTNSAIAYNGTFANYSGYYPEPETFNESFGGSTNCFSPVTSNGIARAAVYTETFSVRYRMNSTKKGLYVADMGSDDGSRLAVDGTLVYNNWADQAFTSRPRVLMSLNGASSLVCDFYENAGQNQVVFQNLALVLTNMLSANIAQAICLGNSGSAISGDVYGTLPAGISLSGTGYQWTYSTSPGGIRNTISGATGATFTPNTAVAPFNTPGTYYVYRNAVLSSANNVAPNPYVATNESNASTITVTALPVATFSYTGTPYCSNGTNPLPTFSGGGVAGTFSSTTGLDFINTSTGQVNLAASTPGTYTVTNTIAATGGCSIVTASSPITITNLPAATISYAGTPFCKSVTGAQPVTRTGTAGGTYSAVPSGLSIDAGTGAVTPSSSTGGSYTVTYTIAASGGCGIVTATTSVTITPLPVATFSYAGTPFPAYTGGGTAGTFSSTAGLVFVSTATGQVNLALSTPGTYTVTNTIAASGGCGVVTATSPITITALHTVGFVWGGSVSSDWNVAINWLTGVVPDLTNDAIIPDATTTSYDPVIPVSPAGTVNTILLQGGGILNGGSATLLTISGGADSWQNLGTFNPGTSKVMFTNANATMAYTTNFFDVTVTSSAGLTMGSGITMRIGGTLAVQGTGVLHSASVPNTIEYNGTNQSVINPNGTVPGYSTLILSGNGTKTLPATPLSVAGNFSVSGSTTAIASSAITISGNVTIGAGTNFTAGAFTHFVGGNWSNSGTFTATGSTINFNGASASNIGTSNFDNIIISGTGNKTVLGMINASGNFTLTSGTFILNNATSYNITVSGNYSQSGGVFDFNSGTSGTGSLFLAGNLTQATGAETMTTSGSGAPNGFIVFNGSATQTMGFANPAGSIWVVFSVPAGKHVQLLSDITLNSANGISQAGFQGEIRIDGIFDLGTSTVSQSGGVPGTAVFTVNSGATLITANSGGISGSVSSSNMTNTFSSAANYEFQGAATGTFTTTPVPETVNNLIVNSPSSVALTNSLTVAGTASLTSGKLTLGTNKLTLAGGSPSRTSGTIDASASGSEIVFAGPAAQSIPAGTFFNDGVNNLTVNNASNVTLNGTLRLLNIFSASSGKLDAFTNAPTVSYAGTLAQTIEGSQYLGDKIHNLTVDNGTGLTLNTNFTVNNDLLINSGKLFAISPGKALTVTGTITNTAGNSGFVLQSDATGTASLLHNTNNVPATVKRFISGNTEAWHFLSSPVTSQSISGAWLPSGTYGNGTGYDMYVWNEPTDCWIYKLNTTSPVNWNTVHPGSDFVSGRGYLYSVQDANPTKEFAGNLNNGSVNYGLTFGSATDSLKGFNLVGNPYPSSIDWRASSGWARSNLAGSSGGYNMWIWNPAANNYGVYNSADADGIGTNSVTRYIAPMQGYFVQAASAGNLGMDNGVRVHNGAGNWFKSAESTPGTLSVMVQSEETGNFDEVQLEFDHQENQPGAKKLFSRSARAPSLFLPIGNEYCSVRYLTDTTDNPMVPLMFKPGNDGTYTLNCDFDDHDFEIVMLEDRPKHYIQNMKTKNTYVFQASTGDDANRFLLHFGPDINASYNELPARIYNDGRNLVIDLRLIGKETNISICDAIGRTLLHKSLQGSTLHKININVNTQLLIIYLSNQQGNICRKLFHNNR